MSTTIRFKAILLASTLFAGTVASINPSAAAVTVSTNPTQNMSCANGVCAPTATSANLNTGDLSNYLASGNLEVTTMGSGVQANTIDVTAKLNWSSASTLALDAFDSIAVASPITVQGTGGLSLTTNDGGSGGTLSFGSNGHVTFANLSSPLTINGNAYTLANTVKTLAAAVTANPLGFYALANNYDASGDNTYLGSPIGSVDGILEGLGNTISHLSVARGRLVGGLMQSNGGTVENLGLSDVRVQAPQVKGIFTLVGGLMGANDGILFGDHVSGLIGADGESDVGGLVGYNDNGGVITGSYSKVRVVGAKGYAGGLVGISFGSISESHATGSVTVQGSAGGLVGGSEGPISNSYATGSATGGKRALGVGGLVGYNYNTNNTATISDSYSTGLVAVGSAPDVGGFIGQNAGTASGLTDCDWDTTTSGTDTGVGSGLDAGLTGLTTQQLQSGLPAGFDPTIWAENPAINNGFPYLIANPPPKK